MKSNPRGAPWHVLRITALATPALFVLTGCPPVLHSLVPVNIGEVNFAKAAWGLLAVRIVQSESGGRPPA